MPEYRVCEICNHNNSVDVLACKSCDADLSFVHPAWVDEDHGVDKNSDTISQTNATFNKVSSQIVKTMVMSQTKLIDDRSGIEIIIPPAGGTIGRSGTIGSEHFQNNLYISNIHARLSNNGRTLTIIDENSTNGTKLNGSSLVPGREYQLENNDEIMLANMKFRVIQ